ncbi:type II toxin-antitoxin system RelE/ParE family toxin [Glaesserella sp.]|uniref:type II toxin-antitoxin system RelE family toxin n=1 Tax=Glaesserella sp. TaxID=2094731 RepID=UPI0035A037B3
MTYRVVFRKEALKEFQKLDKVIANQFLDKLQERIEQPRVAGAKLRGMKDCYKIKLRSSGYRLVYQVVDEQIVIQVVAVGKRDRSDVYQKAQLRL